MADEICYNQNDELYHYGVKGMKWGVRKAYDPVGRKALVKEKSRYRQRLEEKYRSKGMTVDEAEKSASKRIRNERIAIGAAAVVAAIAAYKLADSGELNRLAQKGKAYVYGSPPQWKKDSSLADATMSAEDIYHNVVARRINPDYGIVSPAGFGTKNNCRRCTFAYELRRRGFNVQATKSVGGTGQKLDGAYNATHKKTIKGGILGVFLSSFLDDTRGVDNRVANFIDKERFDIVIKTNAKASSKSIFDSLMRYPDRARGELEAVWKSGVGHSMAWEIINGKPVIFDCQTDQRFETVDSFMERAAYIKQASSMRLDNIELNTDFLKKWIKDS